MEQSTYIGQVLVVMSMVKTVMVMMVVMVVSVVVMVVSVVMVFFVVMVVVSVVVMVFFVLVVLGFLILPLRLGVRRGSRKGAAGRFLSSGRLVGLTRIY